MMGDKKYLKIIQGIYDKRSIIPFDNSTNEDEVNRDVFLIANNLQNTSMKILDIGCGRGWHLFQLKELGYLHLTGIDLSKKVIQVAQVLLRDSQIKLINDDFITYNFSKKFDCAINFLSSLGSFGKRGDKKFLQKIIEILKSKGFFILTIFVKNKVKELEGMFEVNYDKQNSFKLLNEVTYHSNIKKLEIAQSHSSMKIRELFTLYSEEEIVAALKATGYKHVKKISQYSRYYSAFVCQKIP